MLCVRFLSDDMSNRQKNPSRDNAGFSNPKKGSSSKGSSTKDTSTKDTSTKDTSSKGSSSKGSSSGSKGKREVLVARDVFGESDLLSREWDDVLDLVARYLE